MSTIEYMDFGKGRGSWQERLARMTEIVRDLSVQSDPHEMILSFGRGMGYFIPHDDRIAISRRGLERPMYRITRHTSFEGSLDPWRTPEKLPLLEGGVLAELVWGEETRIINDLDLSPDDPAGPYLEGYRSLVAFPHFDRAEGLNMSVAMSREPNAFEPEVLAEQLLVDNLFGRAVFNLVLSRRLHEAHAALDDELKTVADMQKALLPESGTTIPGLTLAAHYQTAARAGGDYYDFFPLEDGRWGIFIADVSGHGTPAAVVMAITHAQARAYSGPSLPPSGFMEHLNENLCQYQLGLPMFVTAFYAVFDPGTRMLHYTLAGHNPPRLRRGSGMLAELAGSANVPLAIDPEMPYRSASVQLESGDLLLLYTDGVTETFNEHKDMFGIDQLDLLVLRCDGTPESLVDEIVAALDRFAGGRPRADDRTLVAARVD